MKVKELIEELQKYDQDLEVATNTLEYGRSCPENFGFYLDKDTNIIYFVDQ